MADSVTARTDERVELMSIVARLAGYPEYSDSQYTDYVRAIEKHFEPYRNHPVIEYAKKLRANNHVSYNAVMDMAVRLGLPPGFKPTVPFEHAIAEARWKDAKTCNEFVELLKQFYKEAKCKAFFDNQKDRYRYLETAFGKVLDVFDQHWFTFYYGIPPKESFHVLIAPGNGGGAYGSQVVYPDGMRHVYAVMAPWNYDSQGRPFFPLGICATLVHEFNHSWGNSLMQSHYEEMKDAAEKLFQMFEPQMRRQAYGTLSTVLNESIVRAATIRYAINHGDTLGAKQGLAEDMGRSFLWMRDMVDLLGEYEKHRDIYPTMEDFMPKVVAFINEQPEKIAPYYQEKLEQGRPRIVSIEQFENGAEDVDPELTEITVNFDKPLVGNGYSFNRGNSSQEHYPMTEFGGYSNDNKTITVKVALKPDFEYHLVLLGLSFKTPEGYPIEDYPITFKTRK